MGWQAWVVGGDPRALADHPLPRWGVGDFSSGIADANLSIGRTLLEG